MMSLIRIGLAFLFFAQLSLTGFAQSGIITTVAGNGAQGFSGDGGPATSAMLYLPFGVAVDTAGNLFIADAGNNLIRKVTPAGVISTVAGNGTEGNSSTGAGNGSPGYSGDGGPQLRPSSITQGAWRWIRRATCSSRTPTTTSSAR